MSKLILGDCLPELQRMEPRSIDLLLTDPPYGIGFAVKPLSGIGGRYFNAKDWDNSVPGPHYFDEMRRVSAHQVIWGANHFAHHLPPSRGWLAWYKVDGLASLNFSDCELAWTSFDTTAKVFNCRHRGFVKDSTETLVAHPTQKALEVMKWCLELFSKPGDLVLDPFMGSGTTAVACALMGRRFIGIERDPEYLRMATRRIALAKLGQL